jgi:hypothetical protein
MKTPEETIDDLAAERHEWQARALAAEAEVAALTAARGAERSKEWRALIEERDAALAREARLATAAAEVVRQVLGDDPSWWTPERRPDAATMVTTKTLGLYDALSDPTATTWLADRERAVAVRALRWAANRALFLTAEADTRRRTESWLARRADAIEAGTEEVPRG